MNNLKQTGKPKTVDRVGDFFNFKFNYHENDSGCN
jgi:hypothetical protein